MSCPCCAHCSLQLPRLRLTYTKLFPGAHKAAQNRTQGNFWTWADSKGQSSPSAPLSSRSSSHSLWGPENDTLSTPSSGPSSPVPQTWRSSPWLLLLNDFLRITPFTSPPCILLCSHLFSLHCENQGLGSSSCAIPVQVHPRQRASNVSFREMDV